MAMSQTTTSGSHSSRIISALGAEDAVRTVGAALRENHAKELTRIGLVVDDEHAHADQLTVGAA